MLTRLIVRNFKRFDEVDIELGNPVGFIGPNNSGKTTALQALALWDLGLHRWLEKRGGKTVPKHRPGVTINRRDLISVPVPDAKLLWHDLRVCDVDRVNGRTETQSIFIQIIVEGITDNRSWQCGLEFYYANEESFYCRPIHHENGEFMFPEQSVIKEIRMAFLPPMAGLASVEPKVDPGRVDVLIGEGQTAQVLRNLCLRLAEERKEEWEEICRCIYELFRVKLNDPIYIRERGEITMSYRERGVQLDISAAGRGLQQILLLLAYLYTHPGVVLLLDEPDAHLEIIRQRQIYQLLTRVARNLGSQIIAASHSEVILNEAAGRDLVIAFVGKPHRLTDRGSQLRKALAEIGFEDYYQAEQTGWVLYLEGSTDLAILQAFARRSGHSVVDFLERPFVCYVGNDIARAWTHFYGLREAKPDLIGIGIFDRQEKSYEEKTGLRILMWKKREIENYLCRPQVLLAYAEASAAETALGGIFLKPEAEKRGRVMQECLEDLVPRLALQDPRDPWWDDVKASDEFLARLFDLFYRRLELPNLIAKSDYHILAEYIPPEAIDPEIKEKLDAIEAVAKTARPRE
ncbi:MAG: AAA family ATPase [Firmicutes bacterium]|nr:AAA family ATPase [Bacillota bacterium]